MEVVLWRTVFEDAVNGRFQEAIKRIQLPYLVPGIGVTVYATDDSEIPTRLFFNAKGTLIAELTAISVKDDEGFEDMCEAFIHPNGGWKWFNMDDTDWPTAVGPSFRTVTVIL